MISDAQPRAANITDMPSVPASNSLTLTLASPVSRSR